MKNEKTQYCPHCKPTRVRSHLRSHLDYYAEKLFRPMHALFSYIPHNFIDRIWSYALRLLERVRVLTFCANPNPKHLRNRAWIFFKEARRRGLDIYSVTLAGHHTNEFRLLYDDNVYHFQAIPDIGTPAFDLNNKELCREELSRYNIPTPRGGKFTNSANALKFSTSLDFPLVVKPTNSSLSKHATYPIHTKDELQAGIEIAKQYAPDFIVEEYISGDFFRVSVIGKEHVFACKKKCANVVGDGSSTIRELITKKNNRPQRGEPDELNTTLHIIPVDEHLRDVIAREGYTLDSVPEKGTEVKLRDKLVLSDGCDIIACSDEMHPQNKEVVQDVARICGTDVIGIDLICEDISQPLSEQNAGIIEVNGLPYLDMHAHPSHGTPDPVTKVVWNVFLQKA